MFSYVSVFSSILQQYCSTWTQDVNWTYKRRSEDVLDVFWTSYARSIYVLCLERHLTKMGKIISNQRKNIILLTYGVFFPEQLFLYMYIYASPKILLLLVKKTTGTLLERTPESTSFLLGETLRCFIEILSLWGKRFLETLFFLMAISNLEILPMYVLFPFRNSVMFI